MFLRTRPTDEEIAAFIAEQEKQPFSYADVGASRTTPPANHIVDHNRVDLGRGAATFARAVAAVRRWVTFEIEAIQLCWPDAPIAAGTTVAILAGVVGAWSLNACRIVYTVDTPNRFGFAYGTLPEHAVCGEERFLVEWDCATDVVSYDILAFSRPSGVLMGLARPLLRREQHRFAAGSKAAMQKAVEL